MLLKIADGKRKLFVLRAAQATYFKELFNDSNME